MTETRIKQLKLLQHLGGLVCLAVVASIWIDPRADTTFNSVRVVLFVLFGFPAAIAAFLLHADKRAGF